MPAFTVSGEVRPLDVEFSYSGAAVSYNLYKDGVLSCVNYNPTSTHMYCNIEIDPTPMTFILTAVDEFGVETSQSAPYTLVPPEYDPATSNFAPKAEFSVTTISGAAPLTVSFDASGSSDTNGSIMSYNWNFGDGGAGTGRLVDYTFTNPGTYTVMLTVADDHESSGVKTATINVTVSAPSPNEPPVAKITTTSLQDGTSGIGFDATASSDADGMIVSYTWDFGDGDTADGNYVEHEFMVAGDYTVVLTVTDDAGASSQDLIIISVVDSPKANTEPKTTALALTLKKNSTASGTLSASDDNNEPIKFSLVTRSKHGKVTLSSNGTFTYKPKANYSGKDRFTFIANNGEFDSAVTKVKLTVTP